MKYLKNLKAIEHVLHTLGLLGSSVAMRQMVCAIELAHEDPSLLLSVTKGLYSKVAEHLGDTNHTAVERNLRALRDRLWTEGDMDRYREMATYNVQLKPTTGEMIDTVRFYMEYNDLFPDC